MANPTSSFCTSKTTFNNFCSSIASNVNACASRISQSPTVRKTVAIVKEIAPTAIAMVGAYYAPARVTAAALAFTLLLANREFVKPDTFGATVTGVALRILLAKSIVATVAAIALIGIARQYIQNKKAQDAAKIEEEKGLQKILDPEVKIPEVEDTDSDMEPILPLVDDTDSNKDGIQPLSDDSSREEPLSSEQKIPIANPNELSNSGKEKEPSKLNSAESSEEAFDANEVSENQNNSVEANTQEGNFEEQTQTTRKMLASREVTNMVNSEVLASLIENEQRLSTEVAIEGIAVVAIQVEEVKIEKEEEITTEVVVSALIIETENAEEIK